MRAARCKVSGCRRKAHARGLCQKHYDESRKKRTLRRGRRGPAADSPVTSPARTPPGVDPGPEEMDGDASSKMCCVAGCASPHHAKGYCKSHYGQLRRRGSIEELPEVESGAGGQLNPEQRLVEIKKRHEILKREIATIHKALESESESDGED